LPRPSFEQAERIGAIHRRNAEWPRDLRTFGRKILGPARIVSAHVEKILTFSSLRLARKRSNYRRQETTTAGKKEEAGWAARYVPDFSGPSSPRCCAQPAL
jgi:hypothetical protein